jgi:ABC-2 type transport system ATP-binding protein
MTALRSARSFLAMATESVIRLRGLTKTYGDHEAVRGIDLDVQRGEIFAFLGPNGAGKTTTVEILEGFRQKSGGEVSVLDTNPWHAGSAWRDRIGIVLQDSSAEPGLTVRECLQLYAGYYRRPRPVGETLELVDLTAQADERAGNLSGGQRRRLDVALALIGDGELVFLDEPTTGFDPSARRAAWEVISGLRDLGKTVFLTTHYMEEAERLADRIAVISAGRIVAEGTPETLGGRNLSQSLISIVPPPGSGPLPATLQEGIVGHDADGRVTIASRQVTNDLQALTAWAVQNQSDLADLVISRPSLEDVYLQLVDDSPTTTTGKR